MRKQLFNLPENFPVISLSFNFGFFASEEKNRHFPILWFVYGSYSFLICIFGFSLVVNYNNIKRIWNMDRQTIWEALGIKSALDLIFPPKPDMGNCGRCGNFAQLKKVSIYNYFHKKSVDRYICSSCKDLQGGE